MAVSYRPEGYHDVSPYLVVEDVDRSIEFLRATFEGTLKERIADADGAARHAEVYVGDSLVMMGQARDGRSPMPATLYVYVEDVDAVHARALAAGASSVQDPTDQFYGDRTAAAADPFGNHWYLATHVEDVSPEEMQRRAAEAS